jgi:hypothetical protein
LVANRSAFPTQLPELSAMTSGFHDVDMIVSVSATLVGRGLRDAGAEKSQRRSAGRSPRQFPNSRM